MASSLEKIDHVIRRFNSTVTCMSDDYFFLFFQSNFRKLPPCRGSQAWQVSFSVIMINPTTNTWILFLENKKIYISLLKRCRSTLAAISLLSWP